jgi:hypothetical protein
MARASALLILAVAIGIGTLLPTSVRAQDASDLAGRWTLNRGLSEFPREIGFNPDWQSTGGSSPDSTTSGGRGRRGSTGGGGRGPFTSRPQSEDDAKRALQLTAEVRNPSPHLTIVETPTAVTITDDRGQSRTFHPDGRKEVLPLDGVPVGVTAKREAGRLVVLYSVEQGRELRYTYFRATDAPQLEVDVQFIERGGGDKVRRIYVPSSATETMATPDAPPSRATPPQGRPAETFNQQPGAELKGLTRLGVVVEDVSSQPAACGSSQGALETAVSKRLSDAGFRVRRNSDEDTYVYVNLMTTSLPNGLCVSRYDVFLYTHTTARLSYQETPVLVQVSLLHKGGMVGGASAAHAEAILRGVQEYIDQLSAQIREANK